MFGVVIAFIVGFQAQGDVNGLFKIKRMPAFQNQKPVAFQVLPVYIFDHPDTRQGHTHRTYEYLFAHNKSQLAIYQSGNGVCFRVKICYCFLCQQAVYT